MTKNSPNGLEFQRSGSGRYESLCDSFEQTLCQKIDEDDRYYFMGICSGGHNGYLGGHNFQVVVGHLEISENGAFFFMTDADLYEEKESIPPLLYLYSMKNNLKIKIEDSTVYGQEFLFNYFSQVNKRYEVTKINTKWRDDLGAAIRFFKINYQTIVPERSFDALLLALSACIDGIEEYGKEFLRA